MKLFDTCYWLWPGILSPELCDAIILEGDKLISMDGRVGGNGHPGSHNTEIRDTNISWFSDQHWVEGIMLHYGNLANIASGWDFHLTSAQNVQYGRYFPDQHYTGHRDDTISYNRKTMRKMSVVIQLSDPRDYEGGDFLMDLNETDTWTAVQEFKQRGSVIAFPSLMKHEVMSVTSGVRHSAVCWIEGPNFR